MVSAFACQVQNGNVGVFTGVAGSVPLLAYIRVSCSDSPTVWGVFLILQVEEFFDALNTQSPLCNIEKWFEILQENISVGLLTKKLAAEFL